MTTRFDPSYQFSTPVTVKCDTGLGNDLYIRGVGLTGMSWDAGIKFTKVAGDNDTWVLGAEKSQEVFMKNRAARHSYDGDAGIRFKFVIVNQNGNVTWEEGPNRNDIFTGGILNPPTFPKK